MTCLEVNFSCVGPVLVSYERVPESVRVREREMAEGEFQLREREREGHIKLYDRHQMGSSYQKYAAMHINFRNQISQLVKKTEEEREREREREREEGTQNDRL